MLNKKIGTKVESTGQHKPDDLKKTLFEVFETLAQRLEERRAHKRRAQMPPTTQQVFRFWLGYTIDHVTDSHIHVTPQEIAAARGVSVTRVKQNMSDIYLALNVCCEAELFILVRLSYIMLALRIPRSQIEEVLWTHVCGLSPIYTLR